MFGLFSTNHSESTLEQKEIMTPLFTYQLCDTQPQDGKIGNEVIV